MSIEEEEDEDSQRLEIENFEGRSEELSDLRTTMMEFNSAENLKRKRLVKKIDLRFLIHLALEEN